MRQRASIRRSTRPAWDNTRRRETLGELGAREAYVLRLRFGLDGDEELTLHEVADRLKLTSERVRQIQNAALKKLQSFITKHEAIPAATWKPRVMSQQLPTSALSRTSASAAPHRRSAVGRRSFL